MSEQSNAPEKAPPAGVCMPCGGRGYVIAAAAGEQRRVTCPWCEGSGERRAGIDAQARWTQVQGASEAGSERSNSAQPERPALATSSD